MNCKPGDLAYIVGSDMQMNIGRIVEVERAYLDHPSSLHVWEVKAIGAPLMGFESGMDPYPTWAGIIEDSLLRPISGVPIDDETPIETNVPEALRLALGIESRSYA